MFDDGVGAYIGKEFLANAGFQNFLAKISRLFCIAKRIGIHHTDKRNIV